MKGFVFSNCGISVFTTRTGILFCCSSCVHPLQVECAPAQRALLQVPMASVLETWSYAADNTPVGPVPQEAESVEGWWNMLGVGEGLDEGGEFWRHD